MSKEFLNTSSLEEAIHIIQNFVPLGVSMETCHLTDALSRITYEDLISPEDLPQFSKSIVDGFAVKSSDTFGASESAPVYLKVTAEVEMGTGRIIKTNGAHLADTSKWTRPDDHTAVRIPTGGMMPEGADSVVMIEYTQPLEGNQAKDSMIEVTRAVAPGENVIKAGEDIKQGDLLFPKGHRLRPHDIGMLAGLGIVWIRVFRKPKIAVISSGPEICPIDQQTQKGQVRDVNAYALSALIRDFGGEPFYMGICPDDLGQLKNKIQAALSQADCVLISGGSSVGIRDFTYQAISELGPPGVLVHGLSIRPGKPTIIGQSGNKPIVGLPGHPASAIVVTHTIVSPIIQRLAGLSMSLLEKRITGDSRKVTARLTRNISSPAGKEDFIRVTLSLEQGKGDLLLATPLFGKSGLISTFTKAHGIVRIPADSEGAYEGDDVEILLF